jgi:hypothetical protein
MVIDASYPKKYVAPNTPPAPLNVFQNPATYRPPLRHIADLIAGSAVKCGNSVRFRCDIFLGV